MLIVGIAYHSTRPKVLTSCRRNIVPPKLTSIIISHIRYGHDYSTKVRSDAVDEGKNPLSCEVDVENCSINAQHTNCKVPSTSSITGTDASSKLQRAIVVDGVDELKHHNWNMRPDVIINVHNIFYLLELFLFTHNFFFVGSI